MTAQSSDIAIESVVIMKNDLPSPAGNEGKVLSVQGGAPAWVSPGVDTNDKVRASSADTTPGYLEPKLEAGDNVSLSVVNPGANEKVRIDVAVPSGLDEKVKVSATDTTPGFVQNKLVLGTGLISSIVNPGADEKLELSAFPEYQPTGNLWLKVNAATGNDTPSEDRPAKLVQGDYLAFPFATIQAAIDATPDLITGPTSIVVDPGFYPHFRMVGKRIFGYPPFGAGLYIFGSTSLEVGYGTTTATGTTKSIIDTTKSWVTNEHRGKRLVTTYTSYVILSNTATSITILGQNWEAFPSGMSYSIQENAVEVESAEVYEITGGYGGVTISFMDFVMSDLAIGYMIAPIGLESIRITGGGSLYAYLSSGSIGIGNTVLVNSADGVKIVGYGDVTLSQVLVNGGGDYGGELIGLEMVNRIQALWDIAAIGGLQGGIVIGTFSSGPLYPARLYAADNASYGILIKEKAILGSAFGMLGGAPVAKLEGSGNGGHGLQVEPLSQVLFSGVPTITGSLGDFTLNRGSTAGTWATAFSSPGIVTNSQMLNRLERLT